MAIKELAINTSETLKKELIIYGEDTNYLSNILNSKMYESSLKKNKLFFVDMVNKSIIEETSINDDFQLILKDKYAGLEILKFSFFDFNKFLPFLKIQTILLSMEILLILNFFLRIKVLVN